MTGLLWEAVAIVAGAAVIVWLGYAIFLPERSCWWCKGSGRNPLSGGGRRGPCWACGGQPWRQTRSARLVRRIWRSLWGSKRWGK